MENSRGKPPSSKDARSFTTKKEGFKSKKDRREKRTVRRDNKLPTNNEKKTKRHCYWPHPKHKQKSEKQKPSFELIPRNVWDPHTKELKHRRPFLLPVIHITYLKTKSAECESVEECVKVLQELKKRHQEQGHLDIKHNFLVGGDGGIYEGTGWTYAVDADADDDCDEYRKDKQKIDIAFIGKFEGARPPPPMLNAAYEFVNEAKKRRIIHTKFNYTPL